MKPDWLQIHRGDAPLIVSFPHTGTDIPAEIEERLVSPWLGRKDADWWIDHLYDFARGLGATMVRTCVSRTVIDVNRDPSGASLYPGQATTELCPTTTFDGERLYLEAPPNDHEIAARARGRSSNPITTRSPMRSPACAGCTPRSCSMTRIRSARRCRACSTGSCRISI